MEKTAVKPPWKSLRDSHFPHSPGDDGAFHFTKNTSSTESAIYPQISRTKLNLWVLWQIRRLRQHQAARHGPPNRCETRANIRVLWHGSMIPIGRSMTHLFPILATNATGLKEVAQLLDHPNRSKITLHVRGANTHYSRGIPNLRFRLVHQTRLKLGPATCFPQACAWRVGFCLDLRIRLSLATRVARKKG